MPFLIDIKTVDGSEEQGRAAASLIDSWVRTDLSAATVWASGLEEGPVRDAGIRALLEAPAFLRAPETTLQWIARIQDPTLRAETQRVARLRWEATDPTAAAAWHN